MSRFERDKKFEHLLILKYYRLLERKPISADNAARVKAIQDARVHKIMECAYAYPFYRERFSASGTSPDDYNCADDLYKFPVLTKNDLRDWMEDELKNNPGKYKNWHVSPTSGSTGRPLRMLQSPREHAVWTANWLRTMGLDGFNPFTGKTMCRPNSLHARVDTSKSDSPLQKLGILRRKYMSDTIWERVETQTLVDEINAYEPDYLYNHKNVLVRIAKYVKENDLYLWKPSFFSPVSEMTDEPSAALMREVFGPGMINAYGMAETGTCAVKLPNDDYFQILSDSHVVNTYNKDLTGPSENGMAVITPLLKTDLPLINYESLDYMETYEKSGLRFASRLQGRMNDAIYHSNGTMTEWANISVVMNYTPEVVAYRLIQDELTHVHLMFVRNPDVPKEMQPEIEQRVFSQLHKIFKDDSMRLTVEWVEDIPADPNGKLRVIVSKVTPAS